jgi:hypothetical protein
MPGIFDYFRGPNPARRRGMGLGGIDPGEARALALLQAMGPMQEAGYERSASPAGAIAKNLIPLFGAIIQGQMLEKQAAQQQEMLGLEKDKLAAETYKALRGDDPKNLQAILARRLQAGQPTDDVVALIKQIQKPAADTELSLVKQSLGDRASDPQAVLDALAKQKQNEMAGAQAAKAPGELDLFRQKEAIKQAELKPPSRQQIDSWTMGISSLRSLDSAIAGFSNTSPLQLGATMATHGMYSTNATRDYQAFKNDWDNYRYGARGAAKAALDRINQEIPPLTMAFADPQGFATGMRHVRDKVAKQFALEIDSSGRSVRVPPEIQDAMGSIIQNQGMGLPSSKSTQIPQELDIDIPPQYATTAKKIFDDEINSGKGAAAAAIAVQSWLKSQSR